MKFRLVDRITHWRPRESIRGVKTVSFEEYRLKAAFGDEPHLPETLLMEAMFQLGNWLVILSSDFERMGVVVRVGRVEFLGRVRPGDCVEMTATVRRWRDDGICFDGRAAVDGRAVAVGAECLAAPAPLAEFQDAEDLRVLYSQIHQPIEAAGDGAA